MSGSRPPLSGLQLEIFYQELFRAIGTIYNACVDGELSSLLADKKDIKKLKSEAERIDALRAVDAKSGNVTADTYNGHSIQALVKALEQIVNSRAQKIKANEDSALFTMNINTNQSKDHTFRLVALLLQNARAFLKDQYVSFDLTILNYYDGIEKPVGEKAAIYDVILNGVHDPINNPIAAAQKGPHEKFFNDLYVAIVSLGPTYEALRKGKLATQSNDIQKLVDAAFKISTEIGQAVYTIQKRRHENSEIAVCYAKGAAQLLFALREHLSTRIKGDTTLVAKLNREDQKNDHHAARLVGLLLKKAYAEKPEGVVMSSSDELNQNDGIPDLNEMHQLHYLVNNVLRDLSDKYVRDNPSYKFLLKKVDSSLKVQPVAAAASAPPPIPPRVNINSFKFAGAVVQKGGEEQSNQKSKPSRAVKK